MELETLQSLPGWGLVIHVSSYGIWLATMLGAREWRVRRQADWLAVEPDRIRPIPDHVMAMCKLGSIVFNVPPWLAMVIVHR